MKKLNFYSLALSGVLMLSACGGGGGGDSSPTPPPSSGSTPTPTPTPVASDIFVDGNAWLTALPAGAVTITPEEFANSVRNGSAIIASTAQDDRIRAQRDQRFRDDRAYLASLPNKDEALLQLLEQTKDMTGNPGDPTPPDANTPPGISISYQVSTMAQLYRQANDTIYLRREYAAAYVRLPADIRAKAAEPAALENAGVATLTTAILDIYALAASLPFPDGQYRFSEPASDQQSMKSRAKLVAGNGVDTSTNVGSCLPTHYAGSYWYPLKKFGSLPRAQGKRGSCWAFTALGALESRERVQNDIGYNLSEQFLINKYKQFWAPDPDGDGGLASSALELALQNNQKMPLETEWTYNDVWSRTVTDVLDGSGRPTGKKAFKNSCSVMNNRLPYNGSCSETTHQAGGPVCTTSNGQQFCAYESYNLAGAVASGTTRNLLPKLSNASSPAERAKEQENTLLNIRRALADGHTLMAFFPLYIGFDSIPTSHAPTNGIERGVLTDYRDETCNTVVRDPRTNDVVSTDNCFRKPRGLHLTQVVGYLDNAITGANAGGGGYMIMKNSWGCDWGDGGYAYIPADYFLKHMISLTYIEFDGKRSAAWNGEQSLPYAAPTIAVKTASVSADLRVRTDLAKFFSVSHPVVQDVRLTVNSDVDGQIYDGGWTIGGNVFAPQLNYTFNTTGRRNLQIVARINGSISQSALTVDVSNSPPIVKLFASGDGRTGQPYSISAQISDINESPSTSFCSKTRWIVTAPDVVNGAPSCAPTVTFNATGSRTVRLEVMDNDGATGVTDLTVNVLAPPANPFPKITSAGVYSRELQNTGNIITRSCSDIAVSAGNTIDLGAMGCSFLISGTAPPRYSAQAVIENPSNELLTYEWNVYAVDPARNTEYNLYGGAIGSQLTAQLAQVGNAGTITTQACRVTLDVKAPEVSRNKQLTVWTGNCTYLPTNLR